MLRSRGAPVGARTIKVNPSSRELEAFLTREGIRAEAAHVCVSVGLPTFNRGAPLRRAIESVLKQTHTNFELVISDNFSTDNTQAVCEEYAQNDNRVRYIRQTTNIGMTPNFNAVLLRSSGSYFMWLSDDDWLDERYLELCLHELLARPDVAIVCGVNHFYVGEVRVFDGDVGQHVNDDSCARVLHWYRTVMHNSMFYGLVRRELLGNGFVPPPRPGEDIYMVASILFKGKGLTLDSTCFHRARGGASTTRKGMIALYGADKRRLFWLEYAMAQHARWDVLHNPVYGILSARSRLLLAVRVFQATLVRNASLQLIGPCIRLRSAIRASVLGRVVRAIRRRQHA